MWTMRMAIGGTTALALALFSGVAVAQTGSDDATPVGVVIEVAENGKVERGEYSKVSGSDYGALYGRIYAETWDASDSRLSGEVTNHVMRHEYPDLGLFLEANEYTLANDAGGWVGTGTGIAPTGRVGDYGHIFTMTLHGEGAYDGLTAFLTFGNEMSDDFHWTLRGAIVADGLPPFPQPPAE